MKLSEFEKGEILMLHKIGMTNVEISRKLNINRKTISLWINRYYDTGTTKSIKVESRKGKLTLKQIFEIFEIISLKECTVNEIIKELNLDISNSTLQL